MWSFFDVGESDTGGLLEVGLRPIWVLLVELLDGIVCFNVAWDCPCAIFRSIAFPVNEVLDAVPKVPGLSGMYQPQTLYVGWYIPVADFRSWAPIGWYTPNNVANEKFSLLLKNLNNLCSQLHNLRYCCHYIVVSIGTDPTQPF